jgi:hypothetical protein
MNTKSVPPSYLARGRARPGRGYGLTVPPIETEPWGERFFQILDPNGLIIQLVQWV